MVRPITWEERELEIDAFEAKTLEEAGGREKVRREVLSRLKEEYKSYGKIYIRFLDYKIRIAFTFSEWVDMSVGYFPDAPCTQVSRFD